MNPEFTNWFEQQTYINKFVKRSHTWDDVKRISLLVNRKNIPAWILDKNKEINIRWRVEYESEI
jgi:hypothetical protein